MIFAQAWLVRIVLCLCKQKLFGVRLIGTASKSKLVSLWPRRLRALLVTTILLSATAFAADEENELRTASANSTGSVSYAMNIRFDIPPQLLVTALDAFGQRANLQILYKAQLIRGIRSPGVIGEYPAQEALEHLLEGTGLTASYADQRAFTLVSISSAASTLPPGMHIERTLALPPLRVEAPPLDVFAYDTYSRFLQARVQHVLASRPRSGKTGRTLRIMVWVSSAGVIHKPTVYATSGDHVLDTAILNVLDGMPVNSSPPAGLPQPLFLRISK